MQKKIISVVLVIVMMLAVFPALLVGANPAVSTVMDYNYYRTVVTTENIYIDSELDEIYKNSQKITSSNWSNGNSSCISFEAYTAVTLRGLYVWAEIKDGSLDKDPSVAASSEDRFQIYLRMDDGRSLSWGWYETDYNGNVNKHPIMSANDIENGSYPIASGCNYSTVELNDAETSTVKLADGSGWRAEMFIPFSVELLNFTNYNLSIAIQAENGTRGDADFGVCYDRAETANAWYGYGEYKPLRLVRYIDRSPSYAPNYVYQTRDIFVNDDVPVYGDLINSAIYVENGGFTIDGKKDAGRYSEHSKMPLITWHTYVDSNAKPLGTPVSDMGDVYVAFDDENLYVYYERYDEELIGYEQLKTYYYFNDGSNVTAGYISMELDYEWTGSYGSGTYGWPGTHIPANKITYARATLGNNLYGAEYKMPLPDGIKAKITAGEEVSIKIAFETTEENSEYNNSKGTKVNLSGTYPNTYLMYDYTVGGEEFIDPETYGTTMVLSKSFTNASIGKINAANLDLGFDITVNYYATISASDAMNAYMRFTREGKTYIAYPQKIEGSREYMFSFKGIAPQCMGDNIKAELVIDGMIVSTNDNYSVRQNCINLLSKEEYRYNVKMNNLIKSLLNYGAAAQKYAQYKTENPINAGYKIVLSTPEASESVRGVTEPISDDLKMTAVGVYFDIDNKIYVKFKAASLNGVTVTMNGVAASVEKYDAKNNIYIAYSDSIPVTEFGIPYSIVLSNGSATQTATYSINSYAYTKLSSANEAMVELAKATYTYGDSAKKYAGYSDTVYTVITYNDADNNAPYEDNYNEVAQIIKDCNPDLVGMQEIQGKPLLGGVSHDEKFRELFADMGYGWIWNSRGYSVGGEHELGERFSPSGVAIAYRLDKFELLETKHFWLSDTPTVASKYEESDYTHDFVTALLKDKITGETFLFVNAHINYKAKANVKQIAKLLALVEDELDGHMHYSSYRKIYTADWNFGDPGLESAGAKLLNEAGYYTTDTLMGNVYKPSTTVSGVYIDCCFVDPDEFKPIKYKVINDHQYSLTTSDHYPVFSKIVWAETYEDVLLEAINEFPKLPDDPTYNDHNDFFFSEEDTDGFIYG